MNERLAHAYDQTPYPDYAFWATQPDHLGMFGRLFGLDTASPDRCRVLEIGCAVGGNLIPMAALAPDSEFVGVDLSRVQIARARATASAAKVDNVALIHGDFRELSPDLGPFDYLICHGVFAWVATDTQDALLRFIRERLTPYGVAFVSYNTYPGQHMVDMVRKLLEIHTTQAADGATRNQQALAVMRFLARQSRNVGGDWRAGFLERELRAMEEGHPALLEHDYRAVASNPVYFVDFVRRCGDAGLAYLADSWPRQMDLDNQDPDIVLALRPFADLVLQGQYLDFIHHCRYRETLICRSDAPLSRQVSLQRIMGFHVGHALSKEPSLDGLEASLPVQVFVSRDPPFMVSNPIMRLALHRLWRHSRYSPSFDELAQEVEEDLHARGFSEPGGPAFRSRLATQLLRAFFANGIRFSLRSAPVARALPERPATGRYQRQMASERGERVTNLMHEVFDATPPLLALLPHMDGSRTIDLLQAFLPEPVRPALAELLRTGFILDPARVGSLG